LFFQVILLYLFLHAARAASLQSQTYSVSNYLKDYLKAETLCNNFKITKNCYDFMTKKLFY